MLLNIMSESPNLELVQSCFSDSWPIYQHIMQLNYMEHQEIYASVRQYVLKNYPQPFSVLELGCGDASWSAQSFEGTAIQTYTGVDLAATGLELAPKNLRRLNCLIKLKQQEMQDFLDYCGLKLDIILISFVLHHLAAAEKQMLLQHCWQHLNSRGTLLLIDVFCRDRESRPEYLRRYYDYIQSQWQQLPSQSIAVVRDHISNSDFPESETTVRTWAREIGFNQVELIYLGTQEAHKALALSKS